MIPTNLNLNLFQSQPVLIWEMDRTNAVHAQVAPFSEILVTFLLGRME